MTRFKKLFLLIVISKSLFIINAQALTFQKIEDPCNLIRGNWIGEVHSYFCRFKGKINGHLNNNIFEFKGEMIKNSGNPKYCSEKMQLTITGTCYKGELNATFYHGKIRDMHLILYGNYEDVFLLKNK